MFAMSQGQKNPESSINSLNAQTPHSQPEILHHSNIACYLPGQLN